MAPARCGSGGGGSVVATTDLNRLLDKEIEMADHQTCPGCGMETSVWKGNGGRGVVKDGTTYCCQECSEGTGCVCG